MFQTISAEQWGDSVRLPANKWIWIWSLAHLAEWDSCLAGTQLEAISYEHSHSINLIFELCRAAVPRLIPALPQTRQSPYTLPKRNWEYWFFSVIIIAFINRAWKTEQSPPVISSQGRECVSVTPPKYERVVLFHVCWIDLEQVGRSYK